MIFNPTVYDEIAFGLREFDIVNVEERVYMTIAEKFRLSEYLAKFTAQTERWRKTKSDVMRYFSA